MDNLFFLSLAFIFGIAFGSFINVVIYRLPLEKSLVKPPSACPSCGTVIKFYDNIPILSYLILKGRCRQCGAGISPRYIIVELLAGLLTSFAFYHFGFTVKGYETVFLTYLFLAIFFIDLDHTIIPNLFTYPGVVIGFLISFLPGSFIGWQDSLIGLLVGGGSFFLISILGQLAFRKEALGLGDVKFAAMLGAFIGWKDLILVLVIASFLGSVVGIALIYLAGKGRKSYIPFGPFLVAGAWVTIYFGKDILQAYLDLVGL